MSWPNEMKVVHDEICRGQELGQELVEEIRKANALDGYAAMPNSYSRVYRQPNLLYIKWHMG